MVGHHYTMSAMKRIGDRSWIGHIWKVLESNGKAAVIVDPFARGEYHYGKEPMVVDVSEFDWTPADELAEAMTVRDAA
ncbi:hypothetical protein CHH26_05105 [Qipengyuania flava]|nr:hypothetical protein CHH26_05105 [Qipengyuania flava]